MSSACSFAHFAVSVSTTAEPMATTPNGRVSLSRFGQPLRSQAHRDRR
jgi:hypothetical protein